MSWEYNNYLAHHGVKGQQWGVRRYHNEDGSLTDAGRKRYLEDSERAMNENRRVLAYSKELQRMVRTGSLKTKNEDANRAIKTSRDQGASDDDIREALKVAVSNMDSVVSANKKARDYEKKMQKYVRHNSHVTLSDIQKYNRQVAKEMGGDQFGLEAYQVGRWRRITNENN